YGATMGFFPVDGETLRYLAQTGRSAAHIDLVERYTKAQGLWHGDDPTFERTLAFDLGSVQPSLAGPSRPEDLVALADAPGRLRTAFAARGTGSAAAPPVAAAARPRQHGDIAIAAIASCTNTANPFQMIAAGLLARNAVAKGLGAKPWIKTSFSPGSRVVPAMLRQAGLSGALDAPRFHLPRVGCLAGGSGPRAAARDPRGDRGAPPRRGRHHPQHPKFRGTAHPVGARPLPPPPAPGGGLHHRRVDPHRPHARQARRRHERPAGVSRRHLARRR